MLKNRIRQLLNSLPYINTLARKVQNMEANSHVAPGHFYSPIFDVKDLKQRESEVWKHEANAAIPGIELHVQAQLKWLETMHEMAGTFSFPEEKNSGFRYYLNNRYFKYTDGFILYLFLRYYQPKHIIEAGSGFSSALMLDTCQMMQPQPSFTFIDPFPERLHQLLKPTDYDFCKVISSNVQSVNPALFDVLEKNDLLFIDSSHVSKMGSDVNYLLFEILPRLKPGVIIHIHDIFHPFLYPRKWVFSGINWNESFIVRALLTNTSRYRILFFTNHLQRFYPEAFAFFDVTQKSQGQSLYIQVNE